MKRAIFLAVAALTAPSSAIATSPPADAPPPAADQAKCLEATDPATLPESLADGGSVVAAVAACSAAVVAVDNPGIRALLAQRLAAVTAAVAAGPPTQDQASDLRATLEANSAMLGGATIPTPTAAATDKPTEWSGIVWESAVDPARVNQPGGQPAFEATGVKIRIQMILYGPPSGPTDSIAASCAEEARLDQNPTQPSSCLMVQLAFDVADGGDNQATVLVDAVITPDGRQIRSVYSGSGYPGTKNNVLSLVFPDASPGSTLKIVSVSSAGESTTHTFTVPNASEFHPLTFSV